MRQNRYNSMSENSSLVRDSSSEGISWQHGARPWFGTVADRLDRCRDPLWCSTLPHHTLCRCVLWGRQLHILTAEKKGTFTELLPFQIFRMTIDRNPPLFIDTERKRLAHAEWERQTTSKHWANECVEMRMAVKNGCKEQNGQQMDRSSKSPFRFWPSTYSSFLFLRVSLFRRAEHEEMTVLKLTEMIQSFQPSVLIFVIKTTTTMSS